MAETEFTDRSGRTYHLVTQEHLSIHADKWIELVSSIVDGYYADQPLVTAEFIDRLEGWAMSTMNCYLPSNYDDPVVVALVKMARKIKKQMVV